MLTFTARYLVYAHTQTWGAARTYVPFSNIDLSGVIPHVYTHPQTWSSEDEEIEGREEEFDHEFDLDEG